MLAMGIDLMQLKTKLKALARRILRRSSSIDYRDYLFFELKDYLAGDRPKRILEIGPKDGKDTNHLLTLEPERLVLIDLPSMKETNALWLERLKSEKIEYLSANFMYSPEVEKLEPFDCIWCTGVIYHNPEQLRMMRRLFDLLKPQGLLVIESATIRRRKLRDQCVVEIIYPASEEYARKYHMSVNVTHLPSASAIEAWLKMVGFQDIQPSSCHRKQSAALAKNRVAFLCRKKDPESGATYYTPVKEEKYIVGKAL
jgi:SAM-dependent methyltransferase